MKVKSESEVAQSYPTLCDLIGLETLADTALQLADVNGDGRITAADAAMILRFVVGLIHTL